MADETDGGYERGSYDVPWNSTGRSAITKTSAIKGRQMKYLAIILSVSSAFAQCYSLPGGAVCSKGAPCTQAAAARNLPERS